MYNVLVTDPIHPDGIALLQKDTKIHVDVQETISQEKLGEIIGNYDALILRSRTTLPKEILEKAKKLKVIGRVGIGVSHIDVEEASRQGIIIVYSPRGNVVSTAEHTLGLLLALAKNTIPAHQALQQEKWERSRYEGTELAGKTLGIIGLGKTGSEVAWRAKALLMNVIAYDPYVDQDYASKRYTQLLSQEEVLAQADFLTLHIPLNEHTRNTIDSKALGLMKKGASLINCAYGGLIDENALIKALESGNLASAALDVFASEPVAKNAFKDLPQVVTTPHLGGDTLSAKQKSTTDACQGVVDVLAGRSPQFPINLPTPLPSDVDYYKPYLQLMEKLGKFTQQFVDGTIGNIEFTFTGDIAKKNTDILKVNFLLHLLKSAGNEHLNIVNAYYVAQDQGIQITEKKNKESNNFASLISVKVITNSEEHIISGTVSRKQPRLVQIDSFWIDVSPEGFVLLTYHRDQPGVIGDLGTLLGKNFVNIGAMEVGRSAPGKDALMVTNLDSEASEKVLDEIREIKSVISCKQVSL
ncbi:MAG: phosphoglycerate dehydrogenase [bacterium]